MNYVRKLISTGSQGSVDGGSGSGPGGSNPEMTASASSGSVFSGGKSGGEREARGPGMLGLSHLKRISGNLLSPSHPLNDKEREEKLYAVLPLFCKVRELSVRFHF